MVIRLVQVSNMSYQTKGILCVNAQFDGIVIILFDKIVQEKRILKAGARTEIDNIYFGTEIKITQGLDVIWFARYERETEKGVTYDFDIVRRLKSFHGKMIPISHEVGATISQLEDYPEVKKWLYKRLREGYMPEDAFRYFKYFLVSNKFSKKITLPYGFMVSLSCQTKERYKPPEELSYV